jgi:tetratricopeptide (TPR) repeat protein
MGGRFSRLELAGRHEPDEELARQDASGNDIRTPEHCMSSAIAACRSGHLESALQLYTRALQGNRALIAAWVGQVQMLVELAEYQEARLWSDKALELFKNNGDLLAAKSRACARQGDAKTALVMSDYSLASPGTSPLRWQARGEIFLTQNPARSEDCFEKSLADPGADWFDRIFIARIYLFYNRPAPALAFAQAGVELQPSHHYAWYILGKVQERLGLVQRAEVSYQRAVALNVNELAARDALESLENQSGGIRLLRWLGGLFRR